MPDSMSYHRRPGARADWPARPRPGGHDGARRSAAHAPWFDRMRAIAERESASPDEVVPAFFDAVAEWITQEALRGDGFSAAATEPLFGHPSPPGTRERGHKIVAFFAANLAHAGVPSPSGAAHEAYVLLVGSVAAAATRGNASHARRAAASIRRLVGSGEDPGTDRS